MKLSEINIRDPYIFADGKANKYYLYSSYCKGDEKGFQAYVSDDLVEWSDPVIVFLKGCDFWATKDFWAPEMHFYKGKYYLFGTFRADGKPRNCQILVSDSPLGPFTIHSSLLAPESWFALDATLYVENEVPYAIFSHEWVQISDGEMCFVRLKDDLSAPVGNAVSLFKASNAKWSKCPYWNKNKTPVYIVDAPFVYEIDGIKFIIWSSWADEDSNSYSVGVAYPKNGVLGGEYTHERLKLPKADSGHAMIFKDFSGVFRICLHENNSVPCGERAAIYRVGVNDGRLVVYDK